MFIATVEHYSHRAKNILEHRITKMDESLEAFLEDEQYVSSLGIFENRTEGRDFGTFVNGKISWTTDQSKQSQNLISVPTEVAEKLVYLGEDWLIERQQVDIRGIDLSWMDQIDEFDFWDLYNSGPAASYKLSSDLNPVSIAFPQ